MTACFHTHSPKYFELGVHQQSSLIHKVEVVSPGLRDLSQVIVKLVQCIQLDDAGVKTIKLHRKADGEAFREDMQKIMLCGIFSQIA